MDGNRLFKYGTKQGLLTSDTYGIDQDKDGNFWFSSLHHGLTRFEPNHSIGSLGRWTHFNEGFQENSYGIFSNPSSGIMAYSPTLKTIFHLSSTEDPETLQIKDWANKFFI